MLIRFVNVHVYGIQKFWILLLSFSSASRTLRIPDHTDNTPHTPPSDETIVAPSDFQACIAPNAE